MSDPWEELDNEVPDFLKDPDCHPFNHASPEIQKIIIAIQRYNLAYFEHHSLVPAGVRLYLDERGMIQRAGAPPIDNVTPGDGKFMLEDLWGPGAEAGVAWRLIDKAPAMKHTTWAETQQKLLEHHGPPNCKNGFIVTGLLRLSAMKEQRCWFILGALKSADNLEAVAALDIEAILVSICSLAGVVPPEGDPTEEVQKVHYELSDDMVLLRRLHQRLKMLGQEAAAEAASAHDAEAQIQKELERFKATWPRIVERLIPGRLASKMEFYAEEMGDRLNADIRFRFFPW